MTDDNITKAVIEAIKGSSYSLLKDKVFPMAPAYIGEIERRAATLVGSLASSGNYRHVEILVTDTKAEIINKVKKAIK